MKQFLLLALIAGLLYAGCGAPTGPTPSTTPGAGQKPVMLKFVLFELTPEAAGFDQIYADLKRYQSAHPGVSFQLVTNAESPLVAQESPGDLALIRARDLQDLVGRGGIEPLSARTTPAELQQFSPQSLARCKAADVLFALPWLQGKAPGDDWLLISYALSLNKPVAVEVMKFLITDPTTLKELTQATSLQPAKK